MSEEEMLKILVTLDEWIKQAMVCVADDKMLEAGVLFGKAHNKVQSSANYLRGIQAKRNETQDGRGK